jgi:hypothetical protein
MEEMKLYNELEESRELRDEIKWKFQLLRPFSKLHNIIVNIRDYYSPIRGPYLTPIDQLRARRFVDMLANGLRKLA